MPFECTAYCENVIKSKNFKAEQCFYCKISLNKNQSIWLGKHYINIHLKCKKTKSKALQQYIRKGYHDKTVIL